jgi:hypothetical protein
MCGRARILWQLILLMLLLLHVVLIRDVLLSSHDLLLFRALTLLLPPHEPFMIRRSISWGRR